MAFSEAHTLLARYLGMHAPALAGLDTCPKPLAQICGALGDHIRMNL